MSVSNAPVALASASFTDFPNAEIVTAGTGISVVPGGSQGNLTISVTGQLTSLANLAATGFVVFNDSTNTYTARTINSGAGISVTRGDGLSGNCIIAQEAATVVQRVYVTGPLGTPGSYPNIEFIGGAGISVAVADFGLGAKAQVTITNTHGSAGTVDSIDAASTTGMLITGTPGLPITESGTINIDLPGSGGGGAVVEGDMIRGGDSGFYEAIPVGTTGDVWKTDGLTCFWASAVALDADSDTGMLITGVPISSNGTIHVNLPGSGTDSAVVHGDILYGNNTGEYTVLPIGTSTQGAAFYSRSIDGVVVPNWDGSSILSSSLRRLTSHAVYTSADMPLDIFAIPPISYTKKVSTSFTVLSGQLVITPPSDVSDILELVIAVSVDGGAPGDIANIAIIPNSTAGVLVVPISYIDVGAWSAGQLLDYHLYVRSSAALVGSFAINQTLSGTPAFFTSSYVLAQEVGNSNGWAVHTN